MSEVPALASGTAEAVVFRSTDETAPCLNKTERVRGKDWDNVISLVTKLRHIEGKVTDGACLTSQSREIHLVRKE